MNLNNLQYFNLNFKIVLFLKCRTENIRVCEMKNVTLWKMESAPKWPDNKWLILTSVGLFSTFRINIVSKSENLLSVSENCGCERFCNFVEWKNQNGVGRLLNVDSILLSPCKNSSCKFVKRALWNILIFGFKFKFRLIIIFC